jgi:hypothetical protein
MSDNSRNDQPSSDPSGFREIGRSTESEGNYRRQVESYARDSAGTAFEKFENFPKYISRQNVARHLALFEIFKLCLPVQGDVIEGGVNWGGGLMWFALMSTALEPFNLQRRIIGFDTFEGFPSLNAKDIDHAEISKEHKPGGYSANSYDDLLQCINNYDHNRPVGHVPKVRLVQGDACQTMPKYLIENPHTVVSLLHLDFDIFEPTKVAIETFFPRMPKGAIILFDELNCLKWPGETQAVLETVGLRSLKIQRLTFEPYISYAVLD